MKYLEENQAITKIIVKVIDVRADPHAVHPVTECWNKNKKLISFDRFRSF